MKNIKRKKQNNLPSISTASLPDIVFILLFFFMTVTTIKNQNLLVDNTLPMASEVDRLNKTDRIIEIFVGPAIKGKVELLGKEARIQVENRFVEIDELGSHALRVLNTMPEHLRKVAMVSIKADSKVKMGIIKDIKMELQKVNLLKVNYTATEGDVFKNMDF